MAAAAKRRPSRPPAPPRRRLRVGALIGGVIAAAFLLPCAANAVGVIAGLVREGGEASPTPLPTGPDVPTVVSTPAPTQPSAIVDAGADTSFDLAVGTGVRVAEEENEWTVSVLGMQWRGEACEDIVGAAGGAVLVADIQVEALDGEALVAPLPEFRYVDGDGETSSVSLVSGCEDLIDSILVVAPGEVRGGRFAIEVPSGRAGHLTYGRVTGRSDESFEPVASWTVPARSS